MKLVTMALMCLLVAGMCLQDVDSMSLQVSSSRCCFKFMKRKIPLKTIRCYQNSSSSCSHSDGLIFKMKGGKQRCALKTDTWVEASLKHIDVCPK